MPTMIGAAVAMITAHEPPVLRLQAVVEMLSFQTGSDGVEQQSSAAPEAFRQVHFCFYG